MSDSYLAVSNGKVHAHVGPDATKRVQAIVLASALKLYKATGIMPTRGVGIARMLTLAGEICGRKYKRAEIDQAVTDLKHFADVMLSALPIIER